MAEQQLLGGCNCGAVRYVVTQAPLTCYICHCHLCQKRTGSAFSLSLVLPAGGAQVVQGEMERSERPLPGGGATTSYTCAACFSRLWTVPAGGRTLNLRAGTLDDSRDIAPVAQMWTSSAQAWAVQSDILTYPEQPTDFMALVEAWRARQER